jgi:hypothetical protein
MEGSFNHQTKQLFQTSLDSRGFNDTKCPGNGFERRQTMGVSLFSDSPLTQGAHGKPDHFSVFQSGKPSSHSGCLTPGAIRHHKGDGPVVLFQKSPVQFGYVISGVEKEGSPFRDVEIAEIKGTVLIPVNTQFTVGERFKCKWTGCRGLYLFAMMHHKDEAGIKRIAGNRPANAKICMHPASSATFTSF